MTLSSKISLQSGQPLSDALLTSCDREQIHRPDAIQPYGLLLIAKADTLQIIAGAGDLEARLAPNWLGQTLPDLLNIPADGLKQSGGKALNNTRVSGLQDETFNAQFHVSGEHLLVELEPLDSRNFLTWEIFSQIDATADRFERCPDISAVCHHGAQVFAKLTEFDRVLVYRFQEDGSGCVMGEKRNEAFPSLMNHHFPASNIPRQARALYLRNRIRVIPDIHYEAAPIRPVEAGTTGIDLSDVQLRSISPVHLQYMSNMGVAASASISLVVDGILWGMITCHNATPRILSEDIRAACRTLAGVMSRQLRNKEELITYQERLRLRNAIEFATSHFDPAASVKDNLQRSVTELRSLFPCDGFAVIDQKEIKTSGKVPEHADLLAIRDWLRLGSNGGIFCSSCLGKDYPPAEMWPKASAGILAITLPFRTSLTLVWSRVEIVQVIEWAGNPHKGAPDHDGILHPRKSFESWEQTVLGHSHRWTTEQKQAARRLRRTLIADYQTQQLRELNATLTATVQERESLIQQKDFLIREVNHRVQNSLQMVASFLKLQARTSTNEETTEALSEAQHRIAAIGLVHRRLYRGDQMGMVDLSRYLEELMEELCSSLGEEWQAQLRMVLSPVSISADRAINVGLVLTELVINASKYAYGGQAGPLYLSLSVTGDRLTLTVSDQGRHDINLNGSGFGTRMMKAVVGSLGGTLTYTPLSPGLEAVMAVPLDINGPASAHEDIPDGLYS
ncbi:histidine kinase dimerization/phosphoacceptor domain -containing protein [Gluconobacter cerinus]|uniref:histidine kinase dimerization/phosphoacceptor domain -containing protein n=1 Tax=Gluconobacter cerinus TaxID=38307 RepID=UPI001B8D463B|nr:histidine kinase dimerization/phosphoacceptor domain -containing protein [Gluconobacter cerinus]MBS0982037.1 GAF domain-containing protein [Gluconobacter cerinus]